MTVKEYVDSDLMALDVANVLAGELGQALLTQERVVFAVPGGTTPGPIFDVLCAADLEWSRVDIILSDERWVPETHAQSNAALLRRRLLVNRAAAARFHPYYQAELTIREACSQMSDQLGDLVPLSVVLLGMGADMHTASLFPNASGLEAALAPDAPMLLPMTVPGHDIERVTLTAPVLQGAMSKHLIIKGQDKRLALNEARNLPPQTAPIAAVLDGMTTYWSAS